MKANKYLELLEKLGLEVSWNFGNNFHGDVIIPRADLDSYKQFSFNLKSETLYTYACKNLTPIKNKLTLLNLKNTVNYLKHC